METLLIFGKRKSDPSQAQDPSCFSRLCSSLKHLFDLRAYQTEARRSKQFRKTRNLIGNPNQLKEIEKTLLPILLCAYAKKNRNSGTEDDDTFRKISELLSLKADPNVHDYDGRRPLHVAASDGNVRVVELLLSDSRTDVNVVDDFGHTYLSGALMGLSECSDTESEGSDSERFADLVKVCSLLHKQNAKVALSSQKLVSKLCFLIKNDRIRELECWLTFVDKSESGDKSGSLGAYIADYDGRTPMHIAVAFSKKESERLLKDHGVFHESVVDRWGKACWEAEIVGGREATCQLDRQGVAKAGMSVSVVTAAPKRKSESPIGLRLQQAQGQIRRRRSINKAPLRENPLDSRLLKSIIQELLSSKDDDLIRALVPSLVCSVVLSKKNTQIKGGKKLLPIRFCDF